MRTTTMLPVSLALVALAAAAGGQVSSLKPAPSAPKAQASPPAVRSDAILFQGGHIVLNDGKGTVADALLARDGKVVAVGGLADLEKRPEAVGAARVDL